MDVWIDGWWTSGHLDGRIGGQTDVWMDGWTDEDITKQKKRSSFVLFGTKFTAVRPWHLVYFPFL